MKRLKRLTREQKVAVSIAGYLPDSWQLEKETGFCLKIVHKKFNIKRTVDRYAIPKRGGKMNSDIVKVVDCLDKYYIEGQCSILNDGRLIGFEPKEKEIPTQTANPSEDK